MASKRTKTGGSGQTTIYDLAETLGVSPSTVSRALAGSPSIGQQTRERVLQAAKDANYVVNANARNLRQGRARTIEVMFPLAASGRQQIADPFYLDMLAVVADALTARDHDILLTNTVPWSKQRSARQNRVDGIIMIGQGQDLVALREFAEGYKPLVVWGARTPGDQHLTVGTDNVQGGKIATEYLLSMGYERIAYIGDPIEPEMEQRREGYFTALRQHGREVDESLLFRAPFDAGRARVATQAAVASGRQFDAIFCGSDVIALNLMEALSSVGKRVPEDVAVVGYDDISLASSFGQKLTTVSQQISVGGNLLVDLLFEAIDEAPVTSAIVPARLMIRETCGAYLGIRGGKAGHKAK